MVCEKVCWSMPKRAGELVHGFEPVVGVEQRGEYGDNQHEVDRVEQGVEYGVEK